MDLLARDTCVPAVTARGAIVEKGQERCKDIGEYLNNLQHDKNIVGARLLAKVVNDNAGKLILRGDLEFFASKLAPTLGRAWIRISWQQPWL